MYFLCVSPVDMKNHCNSWNFSERLIKQLQSIATVCPPKPLASFVVVVSASMYQHPVCLIWGQIRRMCRPTRKVEFRGHEKCSKCLLSCVDVRYHTEKRHAELSEERTEL